MNKILVVEDDSSIRLGVVDNLQMEGYAVCEVGDGAEALDAIVKNKPDLIILDIMLPGKNGLDICRELRARNNQTPIIFLSARGDESDRIVGIELGADDYMVKPFSPRELMVRVKAVLRRNTKIEKQQEDIRFGKVIVDVLRRKVNKEGIEIKLTEAEFKVLEVLASRRGYPVERQEIIEKLWGEKLSSRTVDTHIWSLREKLEDRPKEPTWIETVHGCGYRLKDKE